MRIVIDTNVIASGVFFGGKPGKLLEMVVSKELEAYITEDILTEYKETLEELCSRYPSKPPRLPLSILLAAMKMIQPHSTVQVCRDPDDDKFIECALDAQCVYIVSGDQDLLSVRQYERVRIVTVSEFLAG
jgi:putative PIN family toxin of toxin-antitoxin system